MITIITINSKWETWQLRKGCIRIMASKGWCTRSNYVKAYLCHHLQHQHQHQQQHHLQRYEYYHHQQSTWHYRNWQCWLLQANAHNLWYMGSVYLWACANLRIYTSQLYAHSVAESWQCATKKKFLIFMPLAWAAAALDDRGVRHLDIKSSISGF